MEPNAQPVLAVADDISIIDITREETELSMYKDNNLFSDEDNDDILLATLRDELHGLEDRPLQQMGVDNPVDSPPTTAVAMGLEEGSGTKKASIETHAKNDPNNRRKHWATQSQLKMATVTKNKIRTDKPSTPKRKSKAPTKNLSLQSLPRLAKKNKGTEAAGCVVGNNRTGTGIGNDDNDDDDWNKENEEEENTIESEADI